MWATQFEIDLSSKCQLNTQLDDQSNDNHKSCLLIKFNIWSLISLKILTA